MRRTSTITFGLPCDWSIVSEVEFSDVNEVLGWNKRKQDYEILKFKHGALKYILLNENRVTSYTLGYVYTLTGFLMVGSDIINYHTHLQRKLSKLLFFGRTARLFCGIANSTYKRIEIIISLIIIKWSWNPTLAQHFLHL